MCYTWVDPLRQCHHVTMLQVWRLPLPYHATKHQHNKIAIYPLCWTNQLFSFVKLFFQGSYIFERQTVKLQVKWDLLGFKHKRISWAFTWKSWFFSRISRKTRKCKKQNVSSFVGHPVNIEIRLLSICHHTYKPACLSTGGRSRKGV